MPSLRIWKRTTRSQVRPAAVPSPRRSSRFSLPFGAAALKARLALAGAASSTEIQAHLWDVSDEGGCLSIAGVCNLAVPSSAVLELRDPATRQTRTFSVELRWISTLSHATFVGLRFAAGPLPADSFLREYMQTSWTDVVPGGARFA